MDKLSRRNRNLENLMPVNNAAFINQGTINL